MAKSFKIKTPVLPNFLRLEGIKGTIDLGELSQEEYEEFEKQFVFDLKSHWKQRKSHM